jgi:hypothetical protein
MFVEVDISVRWFGAQGNGATDDTGAIQAAINAAVATGGTIHFPTGTYKLSAGLSIDGVLKIKGHGTATLAGSFPGDYLLKKTSTIPQTLVVEDLVFDACHAPAASCLSLTYTDVLRVRNCSFKNFDQWGVWLGMASGTSNALNNDAVFERCSFISSSKTGYEHLLIFNTDHVIVRNCTFLGNSCNRYGLGLYQQVSRANIAACHFGPSIKGAYYSISSKKLQFTGCEFIGCDTGIRGANESDNGSFNSATCNSLSVNHCTFESIGDGEALRVGNVDGYDVIGCEFRSCRAVCIIDSHGSLNTVPAAGAVKGRIVGNLFDNNNSLGIAQDSNPPILFAPGVNTPGMTTIVGNTFTSSTGTQQRNICFAGANTFSQYTITANQFDPNVKTPIKTVDSAVLSNCLTTGNN